MESQIPVLGGTVFCLGKCVLKMQKGTFIAKLTLMLACKIGCEEVRIHQWFLLCALCLFFKLFLSVSRIVIIVSFSKADFSSSARHHQDNLAKRFYHPSLLLRTVISYERIRRLNRFPNKSPFPSKRASDIDINNRV